MPATEQTWRNQKTLHVVFGASAVLMAIATIWMTAVDHNREWKDWQLKDRRKDAWMALSRRDALADQYASRMNEYEAEIRTFDSQTIPPGVVDDFKERVRDEDAERARERGESVEEPADDEQDTTRVTQTSLQTPIDGENDGNEKQFEDLNE